MTLTMDHTPSMRPSERSYGHRIALDTYHQQYPPHTAPPPLQIPHSDPFQTNRDPFLPSSHPSHGRRGSVGVSARAWQPQATPPLHHPPTHPPSQPPQNGIAPMSLPYDPSRRRSLGGASPPLPHGSREPPPPPPPHFQSRHMPPPSPPHLPSSASSLPGSAPRGPPTASPFASLRDLASHASHRPSGGMSISSILGADDQRKPHTSPNAISVGAMTPKTMPPPSPGRARSSSMRESGARGYGDSSPPRPPFGNARPPATPLGYDRNISEPRRDAPFESPHVQHGFRAYQPAQPDHRPGMNGHGTPGRPNSQPIEHAVPRGYEFAAEREEQYEERLAGFRRFAEPQVQPPYQRNVSSARPEVTPFQNGEGPTSQPADREYPSPQMERQRSHTGPTNFRPGAFGTPMREDQAGLFRPAYQPRMDGARESLDGPRYSEMHREVPRSSPTLTDLERMRHGYMDRPMTLEEHQRMEAMHREQQQNRKESDGSVHRALLNISPELNRKGRNSPLPQAVQGAQPRHVGPGGDNPGIKMEFGRMFSGLGLGSGVGTATPTAGQSVNGTTTPSRMSPATRLEGGDLVRTAVAEIEGGKSGGRGGKKNGRHLPDDDEQANGTETPDQLRATKRAKPNPPSHHHHHHVHPHHHHHYHHEPIDNGPSPFNMLRFPSNPAPQPAAPLTTPAHHHHHHHTTHAHPGHHHHHAPRPTLTRRPTTTVNSLQLVQEAAKKSRKHLGSQLYTAEVVPAPSSETPADAKIKYCTRMKPIPVFEGKENCTYTVRVPRSFLGSPAHPGEKANPEPFREICRQRNLYGSDVYTDDSDVVAAAVHSGWIQGDFGEYNDDLRQLSPPADEPEPDTNSPPATALTLATRPAKPVPIPPNHDAHISLLILPPLESYASTTQHHIWSREWGAQHDGMSFMICRVDFVEETTGSRGVERGARARKGRLRQEERRRREAAEGMMRLFGGGGSGVVSVRA